MDLGSTLTSAARRWPDRVALVFEGRRWTYREWNHDVNRAAHAFRTRGIAKGDRVATLTYNRPEQVTAFYALLKLGAVPVPINYRLAAPDVAYIIEDSGARMLLFEEALRERAARIETALGILYVGDRPEPGEIPFTQFLHGQPDDEPVAAVDAADPAFIMYTSGTTGRPKGVLRSHGSEVVGSLAMAIETGMRHDDVMLDNSPLFHIAQLQLQFVPMVQLGATNVLTRGFDVEETLSLVAQERVTVLHGVPTQLVMLVDADLSRHDLSSLRCGFFGGGTLADDVTRRCLELFPEFFGNIYGSTEALMVTMCDYRRHPGKLGSVGHASTLMEVRVVDADADDPDRVVDPGAIGELIARGPTVMSGYLNLPERTAAALSHGWYHSGDAAYTDRDGFIYVLGRLDHTIKSGGENVHPSEVENVLFAHAGIAAAAVVGVPSRKWGQAVAAAIVRKDPGLDAAAIDRHCREHPGFAAFKRPRVIVFVDEIPANPTGKVDRGILRERILSLAGDAIE